MNNWKNSFSKTILSRGYNYFRNGKVTKLKKTDNLYTAVIKGSYNYDVTLKILPNNKSLMTCDCPYAAEGFKCKHMAALMYAIDNDIQSTQKAEKESRSLFDTPHYSPSPSIPVSKVIKPFKRDMTVPHSYFNISVAGDILTVTPDLYLKAKKLISSGNADPIAVNVIHTPTYYGYDKVLLAKISDNCGYKTEIRISKKQIVSMYCNCSYRYQYSEYRFYSGHGQVAMCEHMTALCMKTDEYIQKYNPGDATDIRGEGFLKSFRQAERKNIEDNRCEKQNVTINPKLELTYDNKLTVGYKAGNKRLYILKDLDDFVKSYETGSIYKFSPTVEVDFSNADFDEKSHRYYEFIRQSLNHIKASSDLGPATSSLNLSGLLLDNFYDISEGEKIEFYNLSHNSRQKEFLSVTHSTPQISLTLSNMYNSENGWFEGVTLKGVLPELLTGAKYNYYVENSTLYRIEPEDFEIIKPYYDASVYGNFCIEIGQRNLSEFYYSVLPKIRQVASVTEKNTSETNSFLPPDVEFAFYLDIENGVPLCKALARYGETEYNLATESVSSVSEYRNNYKEELVTNIVASYFAQKADNCFLCENNEDAVFAILQNGIKDLLVHGEVHSTNAFDSLKVQRKVKITLGVSIQSNLMDLTINSGDISRSELADILRSYKLKKTYHRLKNGEFVSLDESVDELFHLTESLRISSKDFLKENIHVPVYRALYLDKMLEKYDNLYSERDRLFRKFIKEFKTVKESDFEIPQNLQKIMQDYQKFGHKWIRTVAESGFGGILADDMGLGKTIQMISVLSALKSEGCTDTSLVVCPASLVYNWLDEFGKYAPQMSVCLIVGAADERKKLIADYDKYDVLITSYDLLKRDVAIYENVHFSYQIIDEAQNIKNHSTVASKAVKAINSKTKFALTGTPIENRLGELWSIFDFLMPGFLYGYETFRKEFETPIVKNGDKDSETKLKNMVTPFILRRLKKDVLKDLPDKIEEIRYADFAPTQQKLYDAQAMYMMNMLNDHNDESFNKGKIQILAELTKIRRICCDPSLVYENYNGESAKKDVCIELVENAIEGNHKVLIFSQFVSMLSILEKELKSRNIGYYKIIGETEKKERVNLVEKFNSDNTPVFLISLKAGGTGLNLTGADVVIHYDPWWNVAAENQATDRAHRIGQKRSVSVFKLIAKNTVEERINELQTAKQQLADAIISENSTAFSSLSKEDIIKIIGI